MSLLIDFPFSTFYIISTGLVSISSLIQELISKRTKIKLLEQEDITILMDHGTYISAALVTAENLITLSTKLTQLIEEIEYFYQEEFENYVGDHDLFSKIGKFVQKIFEE